jgi:hypothetical protein
VDVENGAKACAEDLWVLGAPEPKKRPKRPDARVGSSGKAPKTAPGPPFFRVRGLCVHSQR